MISRLSAAATAFAVLATGSLALAANGRGTIGAAPTGSKAPTPIHLPRVVVIGTRTPAGVQ